MAQSDVEVCNNGLLAIGQGPPFISTMGDATKHARICNQKLPASRRAILRMHPWNFAIKRASITGITITNIVAAATLCRITAVAHGMSTGDYVVVAGVLGTTEANGNWTITKIDADTIDLQASLFVTTYVSGGKITGAPLFDYAYQFALPSDCLRVLTVNQSDGSDNRIEGRLLLTNDDTIQLKYVYDVMDYTKWDTMCYEALGLYLAWSICFALTQNQSLKDSVWKQFDSIMPRVRFVDSTEDTPEAIRADDFLEARLGVNTGFVRDPQT